MNDRPDRLRPVGGFAEVVGGLIPDLSLDPENDLSAKPMWQATIYVKFSHSERLVSNLNKTIQDKLKGRLPMSFVASDPGGHYLMAHFLVEDDSELSKALVYGFADGIRDAIREASPVSDIRADIEFVGDDEEA